jgi:hypothetical protein
MIGQLDLLTEAQGRITRVDGKRGGRHYRVDGFDQKFPSVTTILGVIAKPALIPWARNMSLSKVRDTLMDQLRVGPVWAVNEETIDGWIEDARKRPDQVKDEAANLGTRAHTLIEAIINGEDPEVPPELAPVVAGFEDWRAKSGLKITMAETMVYSPEFIYAGGLDAVAYHGNNLIVLDWKTSKGIYPEMALQVAAYANAIEEMTETEVTEAWIIRFGKELPEFEARQVLDLDRAKGAFFAALGLWRQLHGEPLI